MEGTRSALLLDSTPHGVQTEQKSSRKKKKRRRVRQKDPFDIPGVKKIIISENVQRLLGCLAGIDCTTEKPWMEVDKELLQDNLELHEESSEFLPIKDEILKYNRGKILIGYIPEESREYDEYYICLTEKATDEVQTIIEKLKKEQEERLYNTINKTVRDWAPQGSAEEVDEAIMRNSRPLIEVEVETKYPIFPGRVQFRLVRAEDRRDGYMDLRCVAEEGIVNVYKKRIDASVQVAPQVLSAEAQTICTYPTNSSTQYLYKLGDSTALLEKCQKQIIKYVNENMEEIADLLTVNGCLNLYSDDYADLAPDPNVKWAKTGGGLIKEYMSFMDVHMCKGKMIADAVWHPMWTGIVAIAYADTAPNDYRHGPRTHDQVNSAIYGVNPVLIWSTVDALKPKLILETPREVHNLSFCKFDENVLVGGCKNGQIIIWDIRNKLTKVEELEVLTPAQQKYRQHMNSLMGWMMNIHNVALVRPTAISDLRYSHRGPISGITWLSPSFEYGKLGKLMEIPDEWNQLSMQFFTSSVDGTILIWDLLKKPKIEPGGFKAKKLKRLKRKPSALMVDVSPFQILHLNLRPIYKVNLKKPGSKRNVPISKICAHYCQMIYVEAHPEKKKKKHNERVIYRPDFLGIRPVVKPEIHVGTMEGDYIFIKWDGQDFDSGEAVNSETAQMKSSAKYHDGPLYSVDIPTKTRVTLSVGGKIFAIWRDDFKDRPILWRRNRHMYTSGTWNTFQPYLFTNQIINGNVENWVLTVNSKEPIWSLTYSSEYLTANTIHPLQLKKNIYGAGDKQGAFRLFFLIGDAMTKAKVEPKIADFSDFIDREVKRKKDFLAWQDGWNRSNAEWIKKKEAEERELLEKEEAERRAAEAALLEEKVPEKPVPKGPLPGQFVEWIIEQQKKEQEARIKSTIISKKQLDTKELEKRRKPLQKMEEENEKKKQKQKQRLKQGESIFQETVAMLFPEVVKEKPPPPPDPYASGDLVEEPEYCYYDFLQIADEAEEFIEENPYEYDFDWRSVIEDGIHRRRLLGDNALSVHKVRYINRVKEEAAAKAAAAAPKKVVKVEVKVQTESEMALASLETSETRTEDNEMSENQTDEGPSQTEEG